MKMPKKHKDRKSAMAAADRWFSRYIRLRDATEVGTCKCVTCGNWHHWKNIDCGHFRKRGNFATRYDPKNTGSQCKSCNRFRGGMDFEFGQAINERWGAGVAESLNIKSRQRCQMKKHDFEFIAEEYKQKAKSLATEKGIEI